MNFLEKRRARTSTRLLVETAVMAPGEKPVMATPNAVPPAGECAIFSYHQEDGNPDG
ncbi:MAG: hypothetical protein QF906_00350 [Dehalococcoidales bacterium]|jgi:hypothetical protein|nr:hypothetical protein [Dehalococcoidales bacterium]MDP7286281.1 hypothetical protein [Dehalococcoidales bacterium]MDP7415295.1 hypothetical protein [Dehalococcoidales bacterium]